MFTPDKPGVVLPDVADRVGLSDETCELCTTPDQRWVVVHTKSRQEKALCRDLDLLGLAHYLPTYREVRTHGKRKRMVDALLFSGYVFVRGQGDITAVLQRTDRVANVIAVADQARLVRELRQIRSAIRAGVEFHPHGVLLKGAPARVFRGPLKGIEGYVDRVGSPNRLVLVVETLGRATSIEVNPGDVEPI